MSNWLNLEGKVVIVTGGASGIGKQVVSCLQAAGANAVIVDMSVKTGDEIDGAYCVACNVTDPASVQAMADAVDEMLGKAGYEPKQTEGYRSANWILQDYGDIVVHIFDTENRLFYDLERIWRDGTETTIGELEEG